MSSWQESRGHALLHGGFTSGMANGQLKIEGFEETLRQFTLMQSTNPNMDKAMRKIMRKMLQKVARMTRMQAKGIVGSGFPNSDGDPRQAYLAVKSMVYKRILGGNVNILAKRKRGRYAASLPANSSVVTDKNGQHRGGNRRPRSRRTTDLMSYWGADRGFILRFLNAGTEKRRISTSNNTKANKGVGRGHSSASMEGFRNGNRGSIAARNWFADSSMQSMERMMLELSQELEGLISEMWEGNTIASADNVKYV